MEVSRLKTQSATRTNGRTQMTLRISDHPRPQTTPPTNDTRTQVMSGSMAILDFINSLP